MIKVSIEVNASKMGVKITPPPTPAITAITAIRTLNRNESTIRSILERSPTESSDDRLICVSINK